MTPKLPLHKAAEHGDLTLIQSLLSKGVDVETVWDPGAEADLSNLFPGGRRALHHAVMHAQPDAVRILLEAGSDPNQPDALGSAPLHLSPNAECVEALLEHGADPRLRNDHGDTPLHSAVDPEGAAMLLAAGADLEARNTEEETPIFDQNTNMLAFLLSHGANPLVRDRHGRSLFEDYDLDEEAAAVLIDAGLDVNEPHPVHGGTALHYHINIGSYNPVYGFHYDSRLLEFLLKAGADPHLRNSAGKDAFDLARELYLEPPPQNLDLSEHWPTPRFARKLRREVLRCLNAAS